MIEYVVGTIAALLLAWAILQHEASRVWNWVRTKITRGVWRTCPVCQSGFGPHESGALTFVHGEEAPVLTCDARLCLEAGERWRLARLRATFMEDAMNTVLQGPIVRVVTEGEPDEDVRDL